MHKQAHHGLHMAHMILYVLSADEIAKEGNQAKRQRDEAAGYVSRRKDKLNIPAAAEETSNMGEERQDSAVPQGKAKAFNFLPG